MIYYGFLKRDTGGLDMIQNSSLRIDTGGLGMIHYGLLKGNHANIDLNFRFFHKSQILKLTPICSEKTTKCMGHR